MEGYLKNIKGYWENRFSEEGKIWGVSASKTAVYALELFQKNWVKKILIPGAGYGRNTKLFSLAGFDVVGIEISGTAFNLAEEYDPLTKFYNGSFLDMDFDDGIYDAIYCYNVLHLFRENERKLFLKKCSHKLRDNGFLFFTVFSDKERTFGKRKQVEKNTFESKPGRPVHYFTEKDLLQSFKEFYIAESGIMEDPENHGEKGPHSHILRYIFADKSPKE